jgi:two-component system phosphate regulon sensor histidine kinase PhoR
VAAGTRQVGVYNILMWRSPIFWRLFGTSAVLVAVAVVFLTWLMTQRLEAQMTDGMRGQLESETRLIGDLRFAGFGVAVVMILLALVASFLIARRLRAPLGELTGAAQAVAQGDYGARARVVATGEIGNLVTTFNAMSAASAQHIARMDQDRQQLRAIFKSMIEGVLVLDADENVQFLNEAAGQMFALPLESAPGKKLWQLLRHRQLSEVVSRILASDEPFRGELEWNSTGQRVFAVHGARLPGEPLRGAVLVFHDITPLRMLEQVRQDFVANVSHELKTPLAAIQATVETLLDGALTDPQHNTRFLERIRENAERLHRLVQDLLTLRRIESGQDTLELQPIALQTVVDACVSRQRDRAESKNLSLVQTPPADPVSTLADEEALAEILENLVDNAIKYTPAGGRITLRWFAEGDEAIVQVADTGVGIPSKDLPRIFERFYRVDRARSRALGGTGLGLSIVKHLAQSLGGSVSAGSEIGRGSVFTVRLPLADNSVWAT